MFNEQEADMWRSKRFLGRGGISNAQYSYRTLRRISAGQAEKRPEVKLEVSLGHSRGNSRDRTLTM